MSVSDSIQLAILVILAATMLVGVYQLLAQNRLLKANVLAVRLQTYWMTFDPPLTEAHADEVDLYPDEYMNPKKYAQKYKTDRIALKRYIGILMMYEYLAFIYSLKTLKIPDPVGYDWVERWARDLADHEEFRDVHEWHNKYYPEFSKLVDGILSEKRGAGGG